MHISSGACGGRGQDERSVGGKEGGREGWGCEVKESERKKGDGRGVEEEMGKEGSIFFFWQHPHFF